MSVDDAQVGTEQKSLSSVKVAFNGKGEPSVEAKVYEGATIEEVARIRDLAVTTAKTARDAALR